MLQLDLGMNGRYWALDPLLAVRLCRTVWLGWGGMGVFLVLCLIVAILAAVIVATAFSLEGKRRA